MRCALLISLFVLIATSVAGARALFIRHHDCLDGGGGSYSAGFIDDRTGASYMLYRDCWGHTCLYPLYGPFQPRVGEGMGWRLPSDHEARMMVARTITDPGADVGLIAIDEGMGDTLHFRNPVDEAERQWYYEMWREENGGAGMSLGRDLGFGELLAGSYREEMMRRNTAERATGEMMEHYWRGRFGEGGWPSVGDLQGLANAAAAIHRNGSNILIRQAPANGQMLVIAPLLAELTGPAAVYDAAGQMIWTGDLDAETRVPLDDVPAGLYLVRGEGETIPITVVR